ncbi:MAG TPA: alpha-amylase family glycosyl hydrolase [Actinomycetota bacterium]|nr:alpha-amylase family glycosyl hydrolase [Actinomycetota bacterium]
MGVARQRRRSVIGVVTTAVVAVGCTGSTGDGDVSVTAEPGVRLVSTGGDVFAWDQRIEGSGACDGGVALVNGAEVDVEVETTADGFAFVVPVVTGEQEIAARCTSGGQAVETDPIVLTGRLEPRPTARIEVNVRGDTVVLDGSRSEPFEVDEAAIERYVWSPRVAVGQRPGDVRLTLADGAAFDGEVRGERLELRAPGRDGEFHVRLEVTDAEGRTDASLTYFVVEGGRARVVDMMTEHPAWIDRSIMYAPVHRLWGGGAAAVEERLPYLKELGVDALWLWPPVTTRAEGEEYHIVDYFSLDEEWGTAEEFRSMVDRAHALGLHVMLDFVPNHTSVEHPYHRAQEAEGEGSHYWDFYDRDENGEVTSYDEIFHSYLPNLNFENPQVRRMITEAFAYWIREFDVDGFRVDAAWGIERRAPDYWPEWREELKRIKPDLLLLAEATARESYYFRSGFDVGYDWTDHPGQWPWANLWEFPQEMQAILMPTLTNTGAGYPRDAIVLRFLNNNDTGERFVDRRGVKMTRVASALQFTVPGLPLLFAGDEIGISYEPYSDLDPIPWEDRHGLREWYDQLIGLRRRFPALSSREMRPLTADWGSVVAYVRPAAPGGSPVLVVLNFSDAAEPTIQPDRALKQLLAAGSLEDVMSGQRFTFEPGAPIRLPMKATSVRVLVPQGATS